MSKGWVSLNREITSHWVWDCEFSYGQAWVDLILHACHSGNKLMIKGQLIELDRGQQARSELTLSKTWKWSRNKVRRFLKNLENDNMIECKKGHLTSVITICNYSSFQDSDTTRDTTKGHLTEQQKDITRYTNNNVNNDNNDKQERNDCFESFWKNWIHAKKQIGLGKNYGVKVDAKKKWNSLFSKLNTEDLKLLSEKIVDHTLEVYSDILECDEMNKQSVYYNYRNMYPQKFLEKKGWENE